MLIIFMLVKRDYHKAYQPIQVQLDKKRKLIFLWNLGYLIFKKYVERIMLVSAFNIWEIGRIMEKFWKNQIFDHEN